LCSGFEIRYYCYCETTEIALQLLRYGRAEAELRNYFAAAAQSLRSRLEIAVESLCNRYAIATQVLRNYRTIDAQSL
jgi:hypothetical protein